MTTALRDLLPRVVQLFDASGVPFMIAGSVASTTYGLARSTQDIDVVIDPPNLATASIQAVGAIASDVAWTRPVRRAFAFRSADVTLSIDGDAPGRCGWRMPR